MAIGNHNDLTHIVRTSDQWKNTYDKYELIPVGVLCVELVSSDVTKIKIGDGHNIFSKLPYIGDLDLSKYYTKLETDTRIKEILTQEKVVRIKGIIGSKSDLPADARCGDIYFVRQLSSSDNKYIEYIYSPDNTWESLGGIPVDIDLSEYAKTAYVDDKIEQVNERIDDIEQHGTHTHPNKEILDQITEPYTTADKETLASLHNYDDTEIRELISQSSHTHANKDILDATSAAFTREDKSKLDQLNPYDDSILKEKIQALERLAHEHSNKRILDRTTASFTTEYERKMRWIRLYTGCTGMEEGIAGLVPAAQAGEEDYVLSGSGEWVPQTGGGGTYELPIATTSTLGGIKVGDGLEIDANGKLSVVGGGGGGNSIAEGDGITITTDQQTGVKTISVNTGNGLQFNQDGELEIDPSIIPEVSQYYPGEAIDITASSGSNLPAGYAEVDYIEALGNSYTIIDYIPNRNTKIIGTAMMTDTSPDAVVFGARTNSNGQQFVFWFNRYSSTQAKVGFVYGTNTWSTSTDANDGRLIPYVVGDQFTFLLSLEDEFNVNSEFVHNITENGTPASDIKLGIFALTTTNTDIESSDTIFKGRMYEFKIYENDELVVNLVPAIYISTGSVGFYDTIGDTFYTSRTSTPFICDPSTVHVSGYLVNVKYNQGLTVNQDNELEVNTSDGLTVNQNNELEVNLGAGLQFDNNNAIEINIGTGVNINDNNELNIELNDVLEAGNGINLTAQSSILPRGYGQLSYIEGNGNQWTQLDYVPVHDSRVVVDCISYETTRTDRALFGCREGTGGRPQFVLWCGNKTSDKVTMSFIYGSNTWSDDYNTSIPLGTRFTADASYNGLYINGELFRSITDQGNMPAYKVALFTVANGDGTYISDKGMGKYRIYSFKIYEGNSLVVDLVPAISALGVGLYDVVNDKFYRSLTSTAFLYDASSVVYPSAYQISAKIGSGLSFNQNGEIEADQYTLPTASANTLGGVKVGTGLSIAADGTLSTTGGGGSGGGPEYAEGDAIEIDTQTLSFNVDAIRWDISDIKSIYQQGGPYTQMRSVEFCDSSNVAHTLDSGSAIWDDGDTVSYATVSETIDELVANTGKMCAVWRYPNHVLKLTFNLDALTPLSDIVKFRMKTANDTSERDPKAWKIYVRNATTQQWYLVHETSNAEITGTRDTWSNYYAFTPVTETSINVKYGDGLTLNQNNELEVNIGDRLHFDSNNALAVNPYYEGEGISIHTMGVPTGYTRIKALSSTDGGNQYIDTGYKINPNTVIELSAVFYKYGSNQWKIPLGTRNATDYASNGMLFLVTWETDQPGNNPSLWIERVQSVAPSDKKDEFYNDIVNIRIAGTSLTCTNTRTGVTTVLDTATTMPLSQYSLFVFATNDHGNMTFHTQMDLYSLTISEADTVIHQYIPCKRDSDNKYGLYDTIDQEFKLSPNNALFTYVAGAPSGDTPLMEEISLLPATTTTLGGIKIGDGLAIDEDGVVSTTNIEYEAGQGIEFVTTESEDGFNVKNKEYYFTDTVSCRIDGTYGPRTFTRLSDEPCLMALMKYNTSWCMPIIIGLTAESVDLSQSYNSTILHSKGTVDYKGYTWYVNADYGLANGSMVDLMGNIQTLPDMYIWDTSSHDDYIAKLMNAARDLIDAAELIQTIVSMDVWNGGTGWTNGDYYSGTSDQFTTDWYYTYHYDPTAYIPVPSGALKVRVIGISNENDSHFEGGGANIFDANHHHIGWLPCCTATDEWVDIPEGTIYVQPEVKWNNNNTRTISSSDIKSVTLQFWYSDPKNNAITTKLGNGLEFDENDAIQVKLGDGLTIDENGAIEVTGGSGGGDSIDEGDGITITTDSQTGVKTIGVNAGAGLDIDPITNELFVNGQLPEGTIIKKLTYVGNGEANNIIQFTKKPLGIITLYGLAVNNKISAVPTVIDATCLMSVYGNGSGSDRGGTVVCSMSYNDTTNELTLSQGPDVGARYNVSGETYQMFYLTKGHTGSGTSATNEVSVVKAITYTGTGTSTNNIQFPETPDMILSFYGMNNSNSAEFIAPIEISDPVSPSPNNIIKIYGNGQGGGGIDTGGTFSFNTTTNVLTINGVSDSGAFNIQGHEYRVRYVVNEVIASSNYVEGDGIEITTDQQTGIKTIAVNVGNGLEIDPITGALGVAPGASGNYSAGEAIEFETVTDTHDIVWDMLQMSHTWVNKAYTAHVGGSFENDSLCVHSDITPISNLFSIPQNGTIYTIEARDQNDNLLHCIVDYHDGAGNHLGWNGEFISDPTKQYTSLSSAIYISVGVVNTDHSTPLAISNVKSVTFTWKNVTETSTEISVKYGTGLSVDPITNELFVDGQLPEGTIIKKLTYVGDGSTPNSNIHFSKKPLSILSLNGLVGQNYGSVISTPIDAPYLHGVWGGSTGSGASFRSSMSYDDTTNTLSIQNTSDVGLEFNISGETYTMFYLTKGHTGSGTSVNNEVSVVKTFSYVGTGTSTNNIQFPETPDMILSVIGENASSSISIIQPIEIKYPGSMLGECMVTWGDGISGSIDSSLEWTFNDTTNVLSLLGDTASHSSNISGKVYVVRYVVNEVIPSTMPYDAGEAISIETIGGLQPTNYSNDDFVDSIVSMNAGSIVKAADKSSFTITASRNDCYTRGSSGQANGSYPFNVKASTKYRFAWDSADPTVHGKVYTYENGLYDAMMHEIDQYDSSYLEFTTSPNTTFIQARFGVMYAGDSITYSNVRLYEVIEDEDQYNEISVKHGDGLIVNERNELEVCYRNGLEIVSDSQYHPEYYFNTQVQCQVHTDSYYSTSASFDRTYQKTTTEPALCCIWEVGDSGYQWTGPLIVGTTATSVQYTTQDTQQTVTYQNTFQYLSQTWYTSGYPDFLNAADHEDKLGYLQYLGSYVSVSDQIQAAKDLIDLAVINAGSLQVKLGNGLSFDANGAIQVTGGGGGSGDTVAQGAGIEITTDQQTGNKVIAVNAGTGLQVDQTTNELEIDDSVVTEDDELSLVFVPDDYQPS